MGCADRPNEEYETCGENGPAIQFREGLGLTVDELRSAAFP
jgi:hypothetical protein